MVWNGIKQLKRLVSKKDAAMKSMFTFVPNMEKTVPVIEAKKELLVETDAELLSSATKKRSKSTHTVNSLIETKPSIYLGLALHVEKAIGSY